MKLVLDEMLSPEFARELHSRGHDVEAVAGPLNGKALRGAVGCDGNVELFADLPDEGLDIGLGWLAFTAGM